MLPILSELTRNPPEIEDRTCGPNNCKTCPAFPTGECDGCEESYRDNTCIKSVCYRQCRGCGGISGADDNTMAACGRASSMRDAWYQEVGGFAFDFCKIPPGPDFSFRDRFIPAINGKQLKIPELFPDVEVWVCAAHRLFSKGGHPYSKDFKDYLGLSPRQRLILSTAMPEDWIEMIWRRADAGFSQFNVDYWFPLNASVILDDCKFMQHFNQKRRLLHMVHSGAHFMYYYLGNVKTPSFFAPGKGRVKNLLIDFEFSGAIDRSRVYHVTRTCISAALSTYRDDASYFFDYVTDKDRFREVVGEHLWERLQRHRYYVIGKAWLMIAARGGQLLDSRGKQVDNSKHMDRRQIATENLRYCLQQWGQYSHAEGR